MQVPWLRPKCFPSSGGVTAERAGHSCKRVDDVGGPIVVVVVMRRREVGRARGDVVWKVERVDGFQAFSVATVKSPASNCVKAQASWR